MKALEARFRRDGGVWWVQLCPEGEAPRTERRWIAPKDSRGLFWSLFDPHLDTALFDGPWRLLLVRDDLVSGAGSIPDAPWSELWHPIQKQHVFDCEWTLAEVTRNAADVKWNGRVVVLGDAALHAALARARVPNLESLNTVSPPPRSVLIVGGHHPDLSALQSRAARCALIVWCTSAPSTDGEAPEIVPATGARDPAATVRWLAHFLNALRAGDTLEWAARNAAVIGGGARRGGWWLRMGRAQWSHERPPSPSNVGWRWRIEIDRTAIEAAIQSQAHYFAMSDSPLRVLVALIPGAEGAGLELFRCRDLTSLARSKEPVDENEMDVPWAEGAPGDSFQSILRSANVSDLDDFVQKYSRKVKIGRLLLVRVTHDLAATSPRDGHEHLDEPALRYYLIELMKLAEALANTQVRVMVVAPALGSFPKLPKAYRTSAHHSVFDISEVPAHVKRDDLEAWIISRRLETDRDALDDFLDSVEGLPYETLIERLETQYAEKLRR